MQIPRAIAIKKPALGGLIGHLYLTYLIVGIAAKNIAINIAAITISPMPSMGRFDFKVCR